MPTETKVRTCPHCGITNSDVLGYFAHVGGYADPQWVVGCDSIDACLRRQVAKRSDKTPTIESLDEIAQQIKAKTNELIELQYGGNKPPWMSPEEWDKIKGQ